MKRRGNVAVLDDALPEDGDRDEVIVPVLRQQLADAPLGRYPDDDRHGRPGIVP